MPAKNHLSDQFRPSSRRFAGPEGLAEYVGMDDPEEANDAIAHAKGFTASRNVDIPVGGLSAVHDITRERARGIMQSIKTQGFDPERRIEVLGDASGGIVLDGHHRAIAAAAAGMKRIPAAVYDPGDIENMIDVLRGYQ